MKRCILLACCLFITACSTIRQNVDPVPQQIDPAICIVEDKAVKEGFLETFQSVLRERGYTVKIIQPWSDTQGCGLTATYIGRWKWDLALYLAYARIEVLNNGRRVGLAEYDTGFGGLNMNKFVKGHKKVRELVEQLFPNRTSEKLSSDSKPPETTGQTP